MFRKTYMLTGILVAAAEMINQDQVDQVSLLQHTAGKRVSQHQRNDHHDVCLKSHKFDLSDVVVNNLGGHCGENDCSGDPHELRYSRVTRVDGEEIDLVITNNTIYEPARAELNGVEIVSEYYGQLNMLCGKVVEGGNGEAEGTETDFKIRFVKSGTEDAVELEDFALAVYDVDSGRKHKGRESVTSCDSHLIMVSEEPPSELARSQDSHCHTFSSTSRGMAKDNPTDPDELTDLQLKRTVMFGYKDITEFHITWKVDTCSHHTGRSILFAAGPVGQFCGHVTTTTTTTTSASTTCVRCSTFTCPATYSLRKNAETLCGADRAACCLKDGVCAGLSAGSKCGLGDIESSLIPNPSFEEMTKCPYIYSQLKYAVSWHQATTATSDFWVQQPTCPPWYSGVDFLPKFPDGDGAVGAIRLVGDKWHEYVGACLTEPIKAGTTYSFNMQIAAGLIAKRYGGDTDGETELMCLEKCTDGTFPISGRTWMGSTFPILGKHKPEGGLKLYGEWKSLTIEFKGPPSGCEGIMFGPSLEATIQEDKSGSYTLYDFLNIQQGRSGICDAEGHCVEQR